jgi:hypothetical protein
MRMLALACLATLVVGTSLADPVEAGRRRRRVAIAAGVVAATTGRPTVVAVAAPRVVAAPIVTPTTYLALTPDLTITEMTTEGDLQCVTVKNIGRTASPETLLQIDFRRVTDRHLVATKKIRVSPLLVNQAIRFRLHALPHGPVQAIATVDPDRQVRETNERNNDLIIEIAGQTPTIEPAPLDDINVWVTPDVLEGEAATGPASNDRQE